VKRIGSLAAVCSLRLVEKAVHRFSGEQFLAQFQVVALTGLPGGEQARDFGHGQPLHLDFDRLGGGRGFLLDCHGLRY
jgi:hypothetical protein